MTGGELIFRRKETPLMKTIISPSHFPISPCREHIGLYFLQHLAKSLGVKPLVVTVSSCLRELIKRNCYTSEVTQAAADQQMVCLAAVFSWLLGWAVMV